MSAVTIDLTESMILTVLRAFLIDILPALGADNIVKGQVNRVPEVKAADYIVFWPTDRIRLSTNRDWWDRMNAAASSMHHETSAQVMVQLDIHGPDSTDNAQVVSTMFRDSYAVEFFAASGLAMAPLYTDDGKQMPFINGENQYEDRWVVSAAMQANPIVSTPQQFADTLAIDLIEVDTTYPPGGS